MSLLDTATAIWLAALLALVVVEPFPRARRLRAALWVVAIASGVGFVAKLLDVFAPMLTYGPGS